jgi:hypothetical protein
MSRQTEVKKKKERKTLGKCPSGRSRKAMGHVQKILTKKKKKIQERTV